MLEWAKPHFIKNQSKQTRKKHFLSRIHEKGRLWSLWSITRTIKSSENSYLISPCSWLLCNSKAPRQRPCQNKPAAKRILMRSRGDRPPASAPLVITTPTKQILILLWRIFLFLLHLINTKTGIVLMYQGPNIS